MTAKRTRAKAAPEQANEPAAPAKPPEAPLDATQDLINVLIEHRNNASNALAQAEASARVFNREIERLKTALDKANAELAELRTPLRKPA